MKDNNKNAEEDAHSDDDEEKWNKAKSRAQVDMLFRKFKVRYIIDMGPCRDYWGGVYGILAVPRDYNSPPRTKWGTWAVKSALSFLPTLTPLMPQDSSWL